MQKDDGFEELKWKPKLLSVAYMWEGVPSKKCEEEQYWHNVSLEIQDTSLHQEFCWQNRYEKKQEI